MAAFTAIAVGLGAAAAIGGTAASISQQKKAGKAAKSQYKYERQLSANQQAKERIDMIRQARLQRGVLAQTAANAGAAGDSSIALGALGSIKSQLNRGLSFLDTNQKLTNQAAFFASKANIATSKAQTSQAIAGLGMTVFNSAGGIGAFDTKGATA